ncbi:MAG: hypothetical protein HQL58_07925 [Magnetococcales bacterium]|nr:hypothetical protein [Magnetococcales bacterium]
MSSGQGSGSYEDDSSTKMGSAAAGTLAGAALGAVVSKNKTKGALIGAAVGAAAGYAAGSYLADSGQMQQQRLGRNSRLEEQVRQTSEFRRHSERINEQLRHDLGQLADDNQRLLDRSHGNRSASSRRDWADQQDLIARKRDDARQTYDNVRAEYEVKLDIYRGAAQRNVSGDRGLLQRFNDELSDWKVQLDRMRDSERELGRLLQDLR